MFLVPASPPAAVRGHFITSSAIRISWDDVPHGGQNGKLTAVKVYIKIDARTKPTRAVNGLLYYQQLQQKKNNSSQSRKRRDVIESRNNYFIKNNDLDTSDKSYYHHRSRRSTVDLSGYNTVVLDPSNNDVVLDNLSSFMNYSVALQASTAKGDGPVSTPILVETGESGKYS